MLGKISTKITKTKLDIPIALTLSVIPDMDILIPFLQHRGPAHSIIILFMVSIPILAIYRKKAIPYFLALVQHPLIGDYITGGRVQLLWPISTRYYGIGIGITSQTNITIEWLIFLVATIVMFKTKDIVNLFQPRNTNLILTIPTFTVLLPTFLAFPLEVPSILILPHIVYLALFLTSIVIEARKLIKYVSKLYTKQNLKTVFIKETRK